MLNELELRNIFDFLDSNISDLDEMVSSLGLDPLSDFMEMEFVGLYLAEVDFSGFNLKDARFEDCILRGANFSSSYLENVSFINSNLNSSVFTGTDLSHAKFKSVSLEDARGISGISSNGCNIGKLVGAVLFVEDEQESIEDCLRGIIETFPGIDYEIVGTEDIARDRLENNFYSLVIVDAKIPRTSKTVADTLRGARISQDLVDGAINTKNKNLRHLILTHHSSALQHLNNLEKESNFLGLFQKGLKLEAMEKTVFPKLLGTLAGA